jgi:hypothetical protein
MRRAAQPFSAMSQMSLAARRSFQHKAERLRFHIPSLLSNSDPAHARRGA